MMEKVSRSQKKRLAHALQKTGKKLLTLSEAQLDALTLPDELKEAVQLAWRLNRKQEAYRRQIQYIGRLMRDIDAAEIQSALDELEIGQAQQKQRFRLIEGWRDQLIADDGVRLDWIVQHVPGADRKQLTRLIDQAQGRGTPSEIKSAPRKLFRYLNQLDVDSHIHGKNQG